MKLVQNKRSLLEHFTVYLLKGRREGTFLTLLFCFVPYFSFMAMISVALITLRKGIKNGAFVIGVVTLPLLSVAAYQGNVILGVEHSLSTLVVSWILASILRESCSWSWVMTTVIILSLLAGCMIHFVYPNHVADSRHILNKLLLVLQKQESTPYDVALIKSNIDWFASYFLGVQILMTAFSALSNLAIARYLQSKIYNPEGFSKEFLNFRLSYVNALLFSGALLCLLLGGDIIKTFILVSTLPLIGSGISYMHWRVRRWSKGRLMILLPSYFLLITFPFLFVLFMAVGFLDLWFDFRNFQLRV